MRKDVKLGFAIGGVLLAVLIVYVLVVPGSDKPAPTQSSVLPTETVVADSSGTTPPTLTTPSPTTAPVAVDAPNGTERDVFAKPTDGTQAQGTQKREPKWDQLLDGEVPLSAAVSGVSPIGNGQAISATDIAKTPAPTNGLTPTTQTVTPQNPTTPTATHTHTIRDGETLSSISAAAYGTANRYTDIIKANPGLNPSKLKIGQTINIPAASSSPSEGIASVSTNGEAVSINSTTEYKVAPGDSLYKISVKLYGKSEFSTKIYELNRSAIGNDPAKLKVGSVLKLPQAPTVAAR